MLRKARLYGSLAKFVGKRVLEADISSAAEAVKFLMANFKSHSVDIAIKSVRYFQVLRISFSLCFIFLF